MGQELECKVHLGKRVLAGKAYLETDYLLFRGAERLKILFRDVRMVKASAGILQLDFEGGRARFELGAAAEKWAGKILHPRSRAEKLGVKPGLSVRTAGGFEADFLAELSATVPAKGLADLVFFAACARKDLNSLSALISGLKTAGAMWVVYPKAVQEIREVEVIEAGRAAGLKDVKVASFSATHTALKFVIPADKRVRD